jgi:hypothetical protein
MHPGFAAASDQRGNWRARHVNRSSADLPKMQVDDAAGARLREGNDPISGFRMREVLRGVDVGTGTPAERGRGGREGVRPGWFR